MTRVLRLICPFLSVGLLASGFFLGRLIWFAAFLLLIGVLWMIGLSLHWAMVSPLGMLTIYVAASIGFFLDLSPIYFIPAAIFALLAWDLAGFYDRLSLASPDDDILTLEKRHLTRLLPLALGAVGLSALALSFRIKPSFEWLVILVLFTVWVIGKVVGWLLKTAG